MEGTDPDPLIITRHMSLPSGWSMISIPVMPEENSSVSDLFHDAEVVYAYEMGTGYKRVQKTEGLEVERGYWILLKKEKTYPLTGKPVDFYNLPVNEDGWEMIGGCTNDGRPKTDGCDIDVIYEFVMGAGYRMLFDSDDLKPGKGYWILLNGITNQCKLTVEAN